MDYKKSLISWYQKWFRVIVLSVAEFQQDRCSLRASSLTLYSLFAIVPVMAMAFGIAKGFGFQQFLEAKVLVMFEGREEIIKNVLEFSNNLLGKTHGGPMAIIGVILLVYSLVKLLGHIENALNHIWGVQGDRTLLRKITDYITISIAAGLLVIFSSSATIFVTTRLKNFMDYLSLPAGLENLISFGFNIFPFLSIWVLFVFFYVIIPNKKIQVTAAIVGAVLAGTVFQFVQIFYLKFQVGMSNYNAIYGSFAALPLFLVWLQLSWVILLYGAEIAFAWENTVSRETDGLAYDALSFHQQKLIALRIVLLCVRRFARGDSPATAREISTELKLPLKIITILLEKLLASNILLQVISSQGHRGYSPGIDIDALTIMDVVTAFEQPTDKGIDVGSAQEFIDLEDSLNSFSRSARDSSGERKFKDI